jgi:hypothetical protein
MEIARLLFLCGLVLPGLRDMMAVAQLNYHLEADGGAVFEGVAFFGGDAGTS